MVKNVFINLAVQNLSDSIRFFSQLGFKFNPNFTDESATCMNVSSNVNVMFLTKSKFSEFTPLPVADSRSVSEVLVCLQLDSKEAVNQMVDNAVKAGGATFKVPQDYGFMYGHSFQDLDGHIWELVYLNSEQTSNHQAHQQTRL